MEPTYFAQYKGSSYIVAIDWLYDVMKVIISLIILLAYSLRAKVVDNRVILLMCSIQLMLLVSSISNGLSLTNWFTGLRVVMIVSLLVNMAVNRGYTKLLVQAIALLFGTYSHLCFLTRLLAPMGLYLHPVVGHRCWFLGQKNSAVPILLTAMVLTVYYSIRFRKRITAFTLLTIISSLSYILLVYSVTGIIASFLFLFFVWTSYFTPTVMKSISALKAVIINVAVFVLLVFFKIQNSLFVFVTLFMRLGRNTTLTGRTGLWAYALQLLRGKELMGIGIRSGTFYILGFGQRWAAHLHSYYLQELVEGGILTFFVFIALLLYVSKRYDMFARAKESMIIKCGFLSFLVAFQVETYGQMAAFYILLILMANVDRIEKCEDGAEKEHKHIVMKGKLIRK